MKSFNDWPTWQRVIFTNAIAGVGAWIGLAESDAKLSLHLQVPIVVFVIAFMNVMLLGVAPRIAEQRLAGAAPGNPFVVLYGILKERPFLAALCVVQLLGASQSTATTLLILRASPYVRHLPNAADMSYRLVRAVLVMAGVSALWFSSAIGLWLRRSWGWWLAAGLNGLAVAVTGVLQILTPHEFLLDPLATIGFVLAMIRPVRAHFRTSQVTPQPAEGALLE